MGWGYCAILKFGGLTIAMIPEWYAESEISGGCPVETCNGFFVVAPRMVQYSAGTLRVLEQKRGRVRV